MRVFIITTVFFVSFASYGKENKLLKYFSVIKNDSIVNTRKMNKVNICSKFRDNPVPDSITLKYFFNNDTSNMYYEDVVSDLEFPDSTYIYIIKKEFCPFFYKKFLKNIFLLCYEIEHVIYLSFYDLNQDTIISSYIVSDYTDEHGDQVTHSIIFPNNYIASVETKWGGDVFYKLLKIDIDNKKFVLIKNIKTYGGNLDDYAVYKRTYEILGINEKGELIK